MGVPLDRRDSVASGSGYEKIDEADDHEGKMAKAQLERSMEYLSIKIQCMVPIVLKMQR